MLTAVWENLPHHMHVVVANKQLPLWHNINKMPAKPLIFQGVFLEGAAFVSYPIYQTSLRTEMITKTDNLTHARINFIEIAYKIFLCNPSDFSKNFLKPLVEDQT